VVKVVAQVAVDLVVIIQVSTQPPLAAELLDKVTMVVQVETLKVTLTATAAAVVVKAQVVLLQHHLLAAVVLAVLADIPQLETLANILLVVVEVLLSLLAVAVAVQVVVVTVELQHLLAEETLVAAAVDKLATLQTLDLVALE
jgi:hypothetical protein